MENVEGGWKMLKVVGKCLKWLENVESGWKMLKVVGKC